MSYNIIWIFLANGVWLALFIVPLVISPLYYLEVSILKKLCGDDTEKIYECLTLFFTVGKVTGAILLVADFVLAVYSSL